MQIDTFERALVTNTEGIGNPHMSAVHVRNCRTNQHGWLIPRKGRTKVSDETDISEVFIHKGVVFIVQDGILKWGRLGDAITFHDFPGVPNSSGVSVAAPKRIKTGDERVVFKGQIDDETIDGDFVWISTGKLSFFVEVFDIPGVSRAHTFYMDKPTQPTIKYLRKGREENTKLIDIKFQPVYVVEKQEDLPTQQGFGVELPELAERHSIGESTDPYELAVRTSVEPVGEDHEIDEYLEGVSVYPNPFTEFTNIVFEVVRQTPLRIDIVTGFEGYAEAGNHQIVIVRTLHDSLVELAAAGTPTPNQQYSEGEQSIRWDGTNPQGEEVAAGVYYVRFRYRSGLQPTETSQKDKYITIAQGLNIADFLGRADPDIQRTAIEITLDAPVDHANYLDIYATYRDNRKRFYLLGRMPNVDGQKLVYQFPFEDPSLPQDFIDAGEKVHWQHIATNRFRNYVAKENSNRVYLSYYEPGEHIQLYQNFTDWIPLKLGGGSITGLDFIRDNILVVYATNQIQLIQTDPLFELHTVIDQLGPTDKEGNLIGCAAPDTLVDMGGIHYFLATNRYIYRYDGARIQSVSDVVHAMFQTVDLPVTEYGQPKFSRARGFAYDKNYYISVPSLLEPGLSDYPEYPNTTLLYDIQYRRWWQDDFGVLSLSKAYPEKLFAVIGGELFQLYQGEDDDGTPIRRVWKSNPYETRPFDRIESIRVYPQGPGRFDIKAITEFQEAENYIDVVNPEIWDDLHAGFDIRGRLHTIEITTESMATIDRITTNEKLENR